MPTHRSLMPTYPSLMPTYHSPLMPSYQSLMPTYPSLMPAHLPFFDPPRLRAERSSEEASGARSTMAAQFLSAVEAEDTAAKCAWLAHYWVRRPSLAALRNVTYVRDLLTCPQTSWPPTVLI